MKLFSIIRFHGKQLYYFFEYKQSSLFITIRLIKLGLNISQINSISSRP